jgi:hypothetical protein
MGEHVVSMGKSEMRVMLEDKRRRQDNIKMNVR